MRVALSRALERMASDIVEVPIASRAARLLQLAEKDDYDWIAVVDADVAPVADAFGALARAAGPRTAVIGGRALIGAVQRLGAMFGPARSGPDPFAVFPLVAPQADPEFAGLVRGPIDMPQRGAYLVSSAFVRSLPPAVLDPLALHLDLAVHARAAGWEVVCEPSLTFRTDEDSRALRSALANLRRFAQTCSWDPEQLHRDPVRLRAALVMREVRIMGNVRGYMRVPIPPIETLLAGTQAGDGEALRAALSRTGDRYLLVAEANALPSRSDVERLVERLERTPRTAVALQASAPPYGAALFHCGRIVNGASFAGATTQDVISDIVRRLPERRLFAASPDGELVPEALPELRGMTKLDGIFVAASNPATTEHTFQAFIAEPLGGTVSVVYAAGSATTERQFAVHPWLQRVRDDTDPQLAIGLNRALGAATADGIAIVRDDAELARGAMERLKDAFRRIPRLGVAVPRLGGADRPESLPDLGYRSLAQMQLLYDRRAEAFAREAGLLDVATAPVMVVSREALEVVGGFDEAFGFSRIGVEDFTRRVRAANFLVACCDDAYAHIFPGAEAASFVAALDEAPFLRAAYERRWSERRGFDPHADRVPLRTGAAPVEAVSRGSGLRLLLPLRDDEEWLQVRPLLLEIAAAFRVNDALELAIGLDGALGLQTVVAGLREVLVASNVPMDETITVNVDVVTDIAAWRDAGEKNVRLAISEREALRGLPAVAGAAAIRALLGVPIA